MQLSAPIRRYFVSIKKMIQSRIEWKLEEKDLIERFIKGSGPGGQAVDTTNNCVQLQHKPTGATVKCHKTRYLEQNRKEARKLLVEKVDDVLNPECSLRLIRLEKAIQKNHVKQRRAAKKYQELKLAKAGNLDEKEDLNENTQDTVSFK